MTDSFSSIFKVTPIGLKSPDGTALVGVDDNYSGPTNSDNPSAKAEATVQKKEDGRPGDGPPLPPTLKKQRSASKRVNDKFKELRYPFAMLDEETDYLKIDILKYQALGITQKNVLETGVKSAKGSYKGKVAIGSILLPIPQNISSTNSTGWGEDSLNTIAAYGLGATQDIMNDPSFIKGIINSATQLAADGGNLALSGQGTQLSNAFFGSKAVNLLGANTSLEGVLARSTGQILNPNTELLFNGVKLRSFNFSFNLAPRNGREALEIKRIIIQLKRHMAPTSTIASGGNSEGNRGLFLQSPNVFRLNYMTGKNEHQFLNKFIIAALTNVQINYTGSGTYMTYNDKAKTPVHMVMQLSFQELSPVYAEDYDGLGDEKEGVGF